MSEPSSVQTRAFKILQANVNGDYLAQIRILEFARDEYLWDVILLQESIEVVTRLFGQEIWVLPPGL
jgi:hypothetical protein